MFAEIDKKYLDTERPCTLAMVVCNIGYSENQGPIYRPEGFYYHHALWVEAGEAVFRVGDESRVLGSGEGLFCRAGVPHAYERAEGVFSSRWITFRGGEGALEYYHAPEAFYFAADRELKAAIKELEHICQGSGTVLSRSAAGYSRLTEWLAQTFQSRSTTDLAVRQYLETHFAEPLTLDQIAAHVGMDRYSLCRYYRDTQNTTVMEQLRAIRVAKAKQYLRYAAEPIETIGRMCGYDSPSYFGKIFREETGRSPREYRDAHTRQK